MVSRRVHGPARWRRGHSGAADRRRPRTVGANAARRLFTAEENRDLLRQLLDAPEPRELTLATQDPVLLRLPWELMADDAGRLAQRVSVRRQLEEPERPRPHPAKLPCASSTSSADRPTRASSIPDSRPRHSSRPSIRSAPACAWISAVRPPSPHGGDAPLRSAGRRPVRPRPLRRPWHLPAALADRRICFEKSDDGSGNSKPISSRPIVSAPSWRIIGFPSSSWRRAAATVGKTAVFRSVAPRLIQAGVGSVLSMGHAVHVEAARLLLDRFYRSW